MADQIRFDDVRDWVFGRAMPLWLSVGLDRAGGGAVECLTLDGADAGATFKRVRAQAPQPVRAA